MNKKSVVMALGIIALAALVFWLRLERSIRRLPPAPPGMSAMPAGTSLPKKNPGEYKEMMNQLTQSMALWPSLNPDDQRLAVAAVIQLLGQQRGKISRPAAYYAARISQTIQTSRDMMKMPLDRVVIILAVMDYDFDNGQDKDLLAQKILGPSIYEANKARRQKTGLS